jgi:hypothetical protein
LVDWLVPREVTVAVAAAYPGALLVEPEDYGRRDRLQYPTELRRRRPLHWGPCEAPRGERDHERAAFDIAGAASALPDDGLGTMRYARPETAHLVVRGEYGVEAAFTEEARAQAYADRYNLDNLDLIRKGAEPAIVEAVDFYGSSVIRCD